MSSGKTNWPLLWSVELEDLVNQEEFLTEVVSFSLIKENFAWCWRRGKKPIIYILVELFRWLGCASFFLLLKLCLLYVWGVETGKQVRLVLLWMAYGICAHQGAPPKSAGVQSSVSQQWVRWGNPNISLFCLCGSTRAGIKDFAIAEDHVSFRDWILLSWLKQTNKQTNIKIRSNKENTACAVALRLTEGAGLPQLACRWPGVPGRNWQAVKNKCRISEGCSQSSQRNTLE